MKQYLYLALVIYGVLFAVTHVHGRPLPALLDDIAAGQHVSVGVFETDEARDEVAQALLRALETDPRFEESGARLAALELFARIPKSDGLGGFRTMQSAQLVHAFVLDMDVPLEHRRRAIQLVGFRGELEPLARQTIREVVQTADHLSIVQSALNTSFDINAYDDQQHRIALERSILRPADTWGVAWSAQVNEDRDETPFLFAPPSTTVMGQMLLHVMGDVVWSPPDERDPWEHYFASLETKYGVERDYESGWPLEIAVMRAMVMSWVRPDVFDVAELNEDERASWWAALHARLLPNDQRQEEVISEMLGAGVMMLVQRDRASLAYAIEFLERYKVAHPYADFDPDAMRAMLELYFGEPPAGEPGAADDGGDGDQDAQQDGASPGVADDGGSGDGDGDGEGGDEGGGVDGSDGSSSP